MDRSTHSTARPKHLEQNQNRLDEDRSNNKPTSASQKQTAPPTLRNTRANNGIKLYPFIQQSEYKYEDLVISSKRSSDSVVTLSSRPTSIQKKNSSTASEVRSTSFFEHLPEDLVRKILFEQFIDLNDIPATAKNLMHFASISKFNREFIRVLLTEEGLREISFEITKSVIPKLLATLANDKKENFTQSDIDYLVHSYPYLTVDCSYQKNIKFTNRGLEALKKIVSHSGLKEIRIISNLPAKNQGVYENFLAYSNNGLELIYSLLSRKSISPVKVDFIFKNWVPPLNSKNKLEDKSFDKIKRFQDRADKCDNVIFGEINLSQNMWVNDIDTLNFKTWDHHLYDYRFKFIKMMCNIAVSHSAHTISLIDVALHDNEVAVILDEIKKLDKSSLKHLNLGGNLINTATAKSLSELIQSKNTFLETINLGNKFRNDDIDAFIEDAIFKKQNSDSVEN